MNSNSANERAMPESQEKTENRKTVGIRTGRRPIRSETAPKIKPDAAQASARAEARSPTCAWLKCRSGAINGAKYKTLMRARKTLPHVKKKRTTKLV